MWIDVTLNDTDLRYSLTDAGVSGKFWLLKNAKFDGNRITEIPAPEAVGTAFGTLQIPKIGIPIAVKSFTLKERRLVFVLTQTKLFIFRLSPTENVMPDPADYYDLVETFYQGSITPIDYPDTLNVKYYLVTAYKRDGNRKVLFVIYNEYDNSITVRYDYQLLSVNPSTAPIVIGENVSKIEPVEYRYAIAWLYEDTIESRPSPVAGGLFHPDPKSTPSGKITVFITEDTPSNCKVLLYRWTSVLPEWQYLGTITGTYYDDTNAADALFYSKRRPLFGGNYLFNAQDVVAHADRFYASYGSLVKVSSVNMLSFPATSNHPQDGSYVTFDHEVWRLFSWGSHVLVSTAGGWYRLIEGDGFFMKIPIQLPQPLNEYALSQALNGLLILNRDGVFYLTRDEQLQLLTSLDFKEILVEYGLSRYPIYMNLVDDEVSIKFFYQHPVTSDKFWREIRIDNQGRVSGFHTRYMQFS